jgi:hypothetical protein
MDGGFQEPHRLPANGRDLSYPSHCPGLADLIFEGAIDPLLSTRRRTIKLGHHYNEGCLRDREQISHRSFIVHRDM